eukprot:Transcript_17734.p1 GENE.Transcript_17734~~Transcript_17734.p1  ORF type:complete len:289 (-),score=103.29 Transcript_17734:26-892(-)
MPLALLLSGLGLQTPVLRFRDPKTRGEVVLVGCMHYNPTSIGLASSVVREEAASKRLRACVVESCPTRWNSTLQIQPKGSLLRAICDNEMQAAAEVAEEFGRPVELGDQTIEDTGRRITQLLALTLVQLLTPAGWQAIYADMREGFTTISCEGEAIGPAALLDPALLLATPITAIRYPLAAIVKSPWLLLPLLGGFGLVAQDFAAAADPAAPPVSLEELGGAIAFAMLETLVVGRVFLVGLLEERNFALARNIRKAHFATKGGDTVVAILGAAHLNGVKRLLTSTRVV